MSEYIIGIEGTLHEDYIELAPKISGEIIRCRDCNSPSFDEFGGGWCNENCREVKPLDFCAWASRADKR